MLKSWGNLFHRRLWCRDLADMTKPISLMCVAIYFLSCTPVNLYTIDVRYNPKTAFTSQVTEKGKKYRVTVARFNDIRSVEDKLTIGKVVKSDGSEIPVMPKYAKPVDAVVRGLQAYLEGIGYVVSSETPDWDLEKNTINKGWGDVLIGGNIDEFEIICLKGIPVKKYNTKVKFTVFFADVRKGKIFYKITVETKPSLEHIRFSEEMLEQQISNGLTDAIEKIFESKEIYRKIQSALE